MLFPSAVKYEGVAFVSFVKIVSKVVVDAPELSFENNIPAI
jgi:hypothetical protein